MADLRTRPRAGDRNVLAASRAYCLETSTLAHLCELYDDVPDALADPLFNRMTAARKRALRYRCTTLAGVAAKARMVAAGEFFEADPLVVSAIVDFLSVYEVLARSRRRSAAGASVRSSSRMTASLSRPDRG